MFALTIFHSYDLFPIMQSLLDADDSDSRWLATFLSYILFLNIASICIASLWCVYCLKLKRINLQSQFREVLRTTSYRKLFDDLKRASQLNELQKMYKIASEGNPEIRKFIRRRYKKRKRVLIRLRSSKDNI